jgi:hypoxanthine phosphoribosyltransferase
MIALIEVTCKSGCGESGVNPGTWVAIATAAIAVVAVGVALIEVHRLVRAIQIAQQSNSINAVSHCAQRYHDIMRDVDDPDHGVQGTNVESGSWWYRFWDLHTEQFTLFTSSLLDPRVYELWMTELATAYNGSPGKAASRAVAHSAYLDRTLPDHVELQSFFRELSGISVDSDPASRGAQVRALIDAYTPTQPSRVEQIVRLVQRPKPLPRHQVMVSHQAIHRRVRELARIIDRRQEDRPLSIVAILESARVFATDLSRTLKTDLHFIEASSYRGGTHAEPVTVGDVSHLELEHRDVLLVDDIVETGKTLEAVRAELERLCPNKISTCVLLSKPGKLTVAVELDYVGFGSIPDRFVVGYGIDFDGKFRDLPYVSAIGENRELLPAFGGNASPRRKLGRTRD